MRCHGTSSACANHVPAVISHISAAFGELFRCYAGAVFKRFVIYNNHYFECFQAYIYLFIYLFIIYYFYLFIIYFILMLMLGIVSWPSVIIHINLNSSLCFIFVSWFVYEMFYKYILITFMLYFAGLLGAPVGREEGPLRSQWFSLLSSSPAANWCTQRTSKKNCAFVNNVIIIINVSLPIFTLLYFLWIAE